MNFGSILPVVRHLAQFASGYLVSSGLITASLQETLIGVAVGIASLVWWFVTKKDPAAV